MQKIIITRNEETGICDVMDVSIENQLLFPDKEIADCEQDWRGWWYKTDEVPEKPLEIKIKEIRRQRDSLLVQTDKYMITDYPISEESREKYKQYRQYLRDITLSLEFPNLEILTFEKWSERNETR